MLIRTCNCDNQNNQFSCIKTVTIRDTLVETWVVGSYQVSLVFPSNPISSFWSDAIPQRVWFLFYYIFLFLFFEKEDIIRSRKRLQRKMMSHPRSREGSKFLSFSSFFFLSLPSLKKILLGDGKITNKDDGHPKKIKIKKIKKKKKERGGERRRRLKVT